MIIIAIFQISMTPQNHELPQMDRKQTLTIQLISDLFGIIYWIHKPLRVSSSRTMEFSLLTVKFKHSLDSLYKQIISSSRYYDIKFTT